MVEHLRFYKVIEYAKLQFWEVYVTSVVSACFADLFCYPLDTIKTRMQIQGSSSKTYSNIKHPGMFGTARNIIREEGIGHFYDGFSAMVVRHFISTGLRILLYDTLRRALIVKDADGKHKLTFTRGALCGLLAGGIGTAITTPADLIKVRMQMESKRRLLGKPPRIRNVVHAVTSVYHAYGVVGLWKGTIPNAWRGAFVTLVGFYDLSKRQLMSIFDMPDNHFIQLAAAMVAGLASSLLSVPFDVIRTRIMDQPLSASGRGLYYNGMFDCLVKLVKGEGFLSVFKGFMPHWLRCGPWALLFWMTFEQIRRFRGQESF